MVNTSNLKVIDADTGEVVDEINGGDRILRSKSLDYLHETTKWGTGMPFVKVFTEYLPTLAINLSGAAVMTIISLVPYVAYKSNLLCKRTKDHPMNNADIEEVTHYSRRNVTRIMDELVSQKIVARVLVGNSYQYYVNPYIYLKGNRINKTLEAMFKNYKYERPVIDSKPVKH